MYLKILMLMLCAAGVNLAQQIEFRVLNSTAEQAQLFSLEGEKTKLIDSSRHSDLSYIFRMDKAKHHFGFYRVQFAPGRWLDFIYSGEPVVITSDFNALADSTRELTNGPSRVLYQFITLQKHYRIKSDLLFIVLNRYPKNDEYFELTRGRLNRLQSEYRRFIEEVKQNWKGKFIYRYINSMQNALLPDTLPAEKQLAWLKTNGLNSVDFNDPELIYSDMFTNKAIEYLMYFRNPQLPKELLEKEFMKAVDSILCRAKVNQFVYKHVVEYLIDGFKKFGFDAILDYMVENYVIKDDLCLDSKTEDMIQRRINQAAKLKIGAPAPAIQLPDSTGKSVDIKFAENRNTLVIFFASWCPHCQTMLPEIAEYLHAAKVPIDKVYTISMDAKRGDWIEFINKNHIDFVNLCDLKGWEGKAVDDYFIYATPSMFLVDKSGKIIAKPVSFSELKDAVEKKLK